MALEAIASKVLSSYLGDYIDGLDKKNLEVSLISGETQFVNLAVKPTALEGLELPITLKRGFLSKLKLKIPWRNLSTEAAIATVEGLYLVVGPKVRSATTREEWEKMQLRTKERALQLAELIGLDAADTDEAKARAADKKKKEEGGFLESMKLKIVNNIQIFVDNVHVRYEDDISNPEQPFAFGITLEQFHIQSTDSNWSPAFFKTKQEVNYKLITLKNLAAYWDTPVDGRVLLVDQDTRSDAYVMEAMSRLIFKDGMANPPLHQYLIKPISGVLKASIFSDGQTLKLDVPQVALDLQLDSIVIGLNRLQFTSILDLVQYFALYVRSLKYSKYRPPYDVTPRQSPRLWWKFAINSVLNDIKDKHYRCSWEYIKKRKVERVTYMEIYKRKVKGKRLSSEQKATIADLDVKLDYDDIILYRKLTNASIELEKYKKKHAHKKHAHSKQSTPATAKADEKEKEKSKEKKKSKDKESSSSIDKDKDKKSKDKSSKDKDKDKGKDKDKDKDKKKKDKQPGFFERLFASSDKDKDKEKEKQKELKSLKKSASKSNVTSPTISFSPSAKTSSVDDDIAESESESVVLSDEASRALKELYDAIGYNEEQNVKTQYPKDYIHTSVTFRMEQAVIELRESVRDDSLLASVMLSGASVNLGLREEESLSLAANLQSLSMVDYFTMRSTVMASNGNKIDLNASRMEIVTPDFGRIADPKNASLISVNVDVKPPRPPPGMKTTPDMRISAKVLPVVATVSRPLIDRISFMFAPSQKQGEAVQSVSSVVSMVAADTIETIKSRAESSIKYALMKRQIIDIDVDVTAPRITVPENATVDNSAGITVDLGHLSLQSDSSAIIASAAQGSIQEGYFYDTFNMNLTGITAILVSDRSRAINWADRQFLSKRALVDKFDLNFTLQVANVATNEIPKIKLSGRLPLLRVEVSKEKIEEALSIVQEIVAANTASSQPEDVRGSAITRDRMKRVSSGAAQLIKNKVLDTKNRDKLLNMVMDATAPIKKVTFADPSRDDSLESSEDSSSSSSTSAASAIQQRRLLAQVQFELAQVTLALTQTVSIDSKPTALPVANIDLLGLGVVVNATNQDVRLRMQLTGLFVEDTLGQRTEELKKIVASKSTTAQSPSPSSPSAPSPSLELSQIVSLPATNAPKQYLIRSGSADGKSGGVEMISISIDLTDRRVPHYVGCDAKIDVVLGSIEVELCRPTLAALLKTATDVVSMMEAMEDMNEGEKQILAVIKAQHARKRSKSSEAIMISQARKRNKERADKQKELDTRNGTLPPPKSVAVIVSVKMGSISVALRKDNLNFFKLSLLDLAAKIVVDRDMVVHIAGHLGQIRARDLQLQGPWADIISIGDTSEASSRGSSNNAAIKFAVDYFDPKMPNWPGHEVVLTVTVASMRFVALTRLFSELEVYFSAFLKMYTMLGYIPSPDDTIVKLNVAIHNPLIIMPKSSSDHEYAVVDLGHISVKNKFDYLPSAKAADPLIPVVSTDNISVEISALNMKTFVDLSGQKLVEGKFIDNIDLNLSVKRPLIRQPNEPEVIVTGSLPRVSLEIASERLLFFASILTGNLSELPLRPDEDELKLVIEFLQTVNFNLLLPDTPPPQKSSSTKAAPSAVASVDFTLQQVSVSLLAGNGSTYDGISTSLIRFGMRNLHLNLGTNVDGGMDLTLNLAAVTLEDTRPSSLNQYKMILSSYTAPPSPREQIRSSGTTTPLPEEDTAAAALNEISVKMMADPKQSIQVVTIQMTRPRIYIVPSQLDSLFEFAFPLIKQALRAQEVFSTRKQLENAASQRRATILEEGNLKQRQETEYQRIFIAQQQELRKVEAQLSNLLVSSLTSNFEEETRLRSQIAEMKQTHTRKLRQLRQTHLEQLKEYRAITAAVMATAETEIAKASDRLKEQHEGHQVQEESSFREQRIHFQIRSPEICLLKDAEASNTAFVVHLGDSIANVVLRNPEVQAPSTAAPMAPEAAKDEVTFKLASFDAYKAEIDPKTHHVTDKILLLQPFDISFKLVNSRADESLIAEVDLSGLHTIISYRDIRLGMEIFQSFDPVIKKIQTELEREKQIIDVISSTLADAAAQAKAMAARRATLALNASAAAVAANSSVGATSANNDAPGSNQNQAFSIRVQRSMLSILNDTNADYVIPLFKAELDQLDSAIDLSSDFHKITLRVRDILVAAYNVDLCAYEPIVEPWEVSALIKQEIKPDTVAIRINTNKALNLNVSKSLIDTIFNAKSFVDELIKSTSPAPLVAAAMSPLSPSLSSISSGMKKTPSGRAIPSGSSSAYLASQGRSFAPFLLKNDTFVPLSYWFSHQSQEKAVKVEPGQEVSVKVPPQSKKDAVVEGNLSKHCIDIKIESQSLVAQVSHQTPLPILRNVPLDKVHWKPYVASHVDRSLFWVSEVVNRGGTKILSVRTSKILENHTPFDLEIQVLDPEHHPSNPWTTVLKSGERISVIMSYFNFKSLMIRPSEPAADGSINWTWFQYDVPAPSAGGGALVQCKDPQQNLFWSASIDCITPESNVNEGKKQTLDTIISLYPSLTIENLLASDLLLKTSADKGANWEFSTAIEPTQDLSIFKSKRAEPTSQTLAFQLGGYCWSANVDLPSIIKSRPRPYLKHPIEIKHTSGTALSIYADIAEPHPGALHLTIYASYWIVNQTGLPLAYRTSTRASRLGGDDNRPSIDLRADPRTWYKDKDKFLTQIAAQKFYYSAEELGFQVADGPWSSMLKVDLGKEKSEIVETVEVKDPQLNRIYSFLVTASVAPGLFWRTNEIRIRPSYILVNKTKRPIWYTQAQSAFAGELGDGDQIPFHWADQKLDKVLQINWVNTDTLWSGTFRINQIDNIMIKIRPRVKNNNPERPYDLINVSIKVRDGVSYVVLRPGEENYIRLYTIENQTNELLLVQQKGTEHQDLVPARSSVDFFWDEPHKPTTKFVQLLLGTDSSAKPVQVDPNTDPKRLPDWETRGSAKKLKLKMALTAKGFTRSILIYEERDERTSAVLSLLKGESVDKRDKLELVAELGQVSVSLVDASPSELAYLSLMNVALHLRQTDVDMSIEAGIHSIQVDNQQYRVPEPVLLTSAEEPPSPSASAYYSSRILNARVILDTRESKIVFIKQIAVIMNPLEINLDQAFILRAAVTAETFVKYLVGKSTDANSLVLRSEAVLPLLPIEDLVVDNYYFQQIFIENVKAFLSLRKGESLKLTSELTSTQATVKRSLAAVLAISSIERAELNLQSFQLQNVHCSLQDFQDRIAKHYTSAGLSQISGLLFNYVTRSVRGLFRGSRRPVAPVRPPRYFPPDNTLVEFDEAKSRGQKMLRSLRIRELQNDHYDTHFQLNNGQMLVFGVENIVLIEPNGTINWRERSSEILALEVNGLVVKLYSLALKDGKPTQIKRECTCANPTQLEELRSKLSLIVQANQADLATSPALNRN